MPRVSNNCVNLWECLTHAASCKLLHSGVGSEQAQAWVQLLCELAQSSAQGGQELTLEPTEAGWLLKVFSCYAGGDLQILIPRDVRQPAVVLGDARTDQKQYPPRGASDDQEGQAGHGPAETV